AVKRGRVELAWTMVRLAELGRHPAAAMRALLERHADQSAFEVVGPGVVHALESLGRARVVERDEGAAVRAAIFERPNDTIRGPRDDHRHLADERGAIVAGLGDVGLEADVVPDRPLEDA